MEKGKYNILNFKLYYIIQGIMEDLVESILDYIRSDYTDYAVMINGEWGSRKNSFLE